MRPLLSVVFLFALACSFEPDAQTDADAAPDGAPDATSLPVCGAQRTVAIVPGIGALAWFTLVWPAPDVIENFQPEFAYDDVTKAVSVGGIRRLYARTQTLVGEGALWADTGTAPQPTALSVGANETHTRTPMSVLTIDSQDVLAAGAALQLESMSPPIPVIAFASAPYVGTPAELRVTNIEAVITAIQDQLGLADEEVADLRPSDAVLESWYDAAPAPATVALAEKLLFAANLFRRGFTSTVVIDAYNDDPHGAWTNVATTAARADNITRILEGFYRELAATDEPSCQVNGAPVPLNDNVVMLVTGDTPKNSFSRAGWPDGSIGGDTFLYIRSNGLLNPGWFGDPASNLTQTNFNPVTGAPDANASEESNDAAAIKGILYAISRGNEAAVELFNASPYDALRAPE